MSICYVIGAGDFGSGTIKRQEGDYIIAGDGGFRHCRERGIEPDLVVGDFDSLGYLPDHPNVLAAKPEKDDTDMHLAIREGIKLGFRQFRIYGGTGGRLSHTIANIQLLAELAGQGIQAELVGENSRIWVITNSSLAFSAEEQGFLSVFSLGEKAEGVTLTNLKYTLKDAVLTNQFALGVSNEFIGLPAEVFVQKGSLLLIQETQDGLTAPAFPV